MTINIFRARKDRKQAERLAAADLAWHCYVMDVISEASKNGMRNS